MKYKKHDIVYYPAIGQTNRTYYINIVQIIRYNEEYKMYYVMYGSGKTRWIKEDMLFLDKELAKEYLKERALSIYKYSLEKIESL